MSDGIQLDKLLNRAEDARLAFVASTTARDEIARHVCAMLNGEGGMVIAGVEHSQPVAKDISESRANDIRQHLREAIVPRSLFTLNIDKGDSGAVLTIDVPSGADRPYVFEGAVYVRAGGKTVPASAEAMRRMVEAKATQTERWERRIATGVAVSDLDEQLIRQTVRKAEDKRGYNFTDAKNLDLVLKDLSLARYGQVTQAADVLFGQRVALRHPQTRLRAVCFETNKGGKYRDEQLLEGPAFHLLEQAMAFLKRHVSIAADFLPAKLPRESKPQYPFNALREGIVNALVHRDYAAFSGGLAVSVYPNKIEIWNSGQLPAGITPAELRRETHASVLVNPDISLVFYLHELMERVGRGTFKIVQECRELGMRVPEWSDRDNGVRLTFHALSARDISMMRFNPRQSKLVRDLTSGTIIRTSDYLSQYAGKISERQARRDLAAMASAGYFERRGSTTATVYVRTQKPVDL